MSSWPPVDGGGGGGAPTTATYATSADETAQLPNSKRVGTFWLLPPGTLAARPAAASVGVGAIYNATDTGVLYRSDGVSSWTALTITQAGALLSVNNLSDLANRQTAINTLHGSVAAGTVPIGNGANVVTRTLATSDVTGITTLATLFSKFIVAGHSYNMAVQNVIAAGFTNLGLASNGGSNVDRGQWPNMIQDILGIGADRKYITVQLPSLGGTVDNTTYVPVEEDCFVEAVSYYPAGTLVTSATNYRSWRISTQAGIAAASWNQIGVATTNNASPFAAGLIAGTEYPIIDLCEVTAQVLGGLPRQAYFSGTGAAMSLYAGSTVCPGGGTIRIEQLHTGTGVQDPGGTLVIRCGGRFRNYSVGGSTLTQSGVYTGGWATSMNPMWNPRAMLPQVSAFPLNLTAAFVSTQTTGSGTVSTVASNVVVSSTTGFAPGGGQFSMWTNSGAQTVTYTSTSGGNTFVGCTIAAGSATYNATFQCCNVQASFQATVFPQLGGFLNGPNGTQAQVTTVLGFGATVATTAAVAGGDHGTINAGLQAQLVGQQTILGYETPSGHALATLLTGINDCGNINNAFDIVAMRETMRAWAAFHACSGFWSLQPASGSFDNNVVATNGTGAWTQFAAPAWGQFGGGLFQFTGTPGGGAKLVISLGAGFSGGPIDLFFMAWGGVADGGTASITVDGAQPPQGAVTVQTTGATPVAGFNNGSVAWSSTGTTTLTRTSGTFSRDDVGKKLKGAGITNGTYIVSFTDTTHVVCNQVVPAGSGTAAMLGCVPMVKRIINVPAGAHTIEITPTAMFSTAGDAEFSFWGYGLEPVSTGVLNPVLLCNVPQILGTYFGFNPNPNAVTWNGEIPKIINGTATLLAGNSTEPALSAFTTLVDLDTRINKTALFFSNDGLHPNTLGHAQIADEILKTVRATITQIQTFSR